MLPWGVDEVEGVVAEIYGPETRRRVVVELTPEISYVVAEPTTVVLPIDGVRPAALAS